MTIAIASDSADFRTWINPLQNILTPSPCDRTTQLCPNRSGVRRTG